MDLEILNPHVMKILIASRKVDSIRAVSRRIGLSYGWTYKWAVELERAGVFQRSGKRIFLDKDNRLYGDVLKFVKETFRGDVGFHYWVLGLFGVKYCFTGIDSVFVWTDWGYNISRYRDFYPIFLKVKKSDRDVFDFYVRKLGFGGRIFYKPVFLDDFPVSLHNGMPVDSLKETVGFMRKYIYNFQPALEIVQEIHRRRLGVDYREAGRNV